MEKFRDAVGVRHRCSGRARLAFMIPVRSGSRIQLESPSAIVPFA
jgi:hypothetical protein